MPDVFSLKSDNDHFLTSTADIQKMQNATAQSPLNLLSSRFVFRHSGTYISGPGFATALIVVPLVL
jgi:hypothetical protein